MSRRGIVAAHGAEGESAMTLINNALARGELRAGVPLPIVASRYGRRAAIVFAKQAQPPKRHPYWTPTEDKFVRQHLSWLSLDDIALRLGRSALGVKLRYQRYLDLHGASKMPTLLTAEHIAQGLGVDGKTIHALMDRGLLPGRRLPMNAVVRVVEREAFVRWIVNPRHWLFFKRERVGLAKSKRLGQRYDAPFWARVRRLLDKQAARLQSIGRADEGVWLTPTQVAGLHGIANGDNFVNDAIHTGKLRAKRWGNWWVLRSDALTLSATDLRAFQGSGGKGVHRFDTQSINQFIVLASAIGLSSADIGKMMKQHPRFAEQRLAVLWREGRMESIARAIGVNCDPKRRLLYADRRQCRARFSRVDRLMQRFLAQDNLTYDETLVVWGVVRVAVQWKAKTATQKQLARSVLHLGRVSAKTLPRLRRIYRESLKW